MSKTAEWMIDIEEKTADLMVTLSGYSLSKDEALDMVRDEFEYEEFDCARFDFNALVDDAMGIRDGGKRTRYLTRMCWEFEGYMLPEMWGKIGEDGVYEDDALSVLGAFSHFCVSGFVRDNFGNPLFVDAKGNVRDYYTAVNLMDDELREELNRTMIHSTPQEFIERYADKHHEKFGEGFAPYDGGAW